MGRTGLQQEADIERRHGNTIERVWLFLRERFLSHRVFANLRAIVTGCCDAWRRLCAEPGRLASLTNYPYLRKVRI